MRTGLCAVQQAMTPESEAVVKQAVSLARRRGHTQVTPLHVASVMLSSSTSLLRRACLQSHSHPLQCKALELCFNVALNRLPASTSSAIFAPHSPLPSLSNALVAAFKRAQAHQRRGSAENPNQNQNQTVLVVRIELEQLVISILDDPSVSRVMREAGISSTQVRSRVEQFVPVPSGTSHSKEEVNTKRQVLTLVPQSSSNSHLGTNTAGNKAVSDLKFMSEDVITVLDTMVSKKKNIAIVGKSLGSVEAVVRGLVDRFEKGLVYGELRYVQFLSLPLLHFKNLSKEQVEQKLVELRLLVKGYLARGVILYLGDLRWVFEYWFRRAEYYRHSSIEHVIMELKRMVVEFSYRDNERRMWLMGIADSQTYERTCKTGNPSLEAVLDLHPLIIPVDNLSLSLNLFSDSSTQHGKVSRDVSGWPETEMITGSESKTLCFDISLCPKTVPDRSTTSSFTQKRESNSSKLPPWFLHREDESERGSLKNQECVSVVDLCKNWDLFCSSSQANHNQTYNKNALNFSSLSPSSSASVSSQDRNADLKRTRLSFPIDFEAKREEENFWVSSDQISEEAIESLPKPELLSNPNSSPNSASSSEATERDVEGLNMFKELSTENLNILSDALKKKAPRQGEVIQDLVRTILRCRSGLTGKARYKRSKREDTWLIFVGPDHESKTAIGKELARIVFGSQSDFFQIKQSNLSYTRSDSAQEHPSKKRKLHESTESSCLERFSEALNENPHRVFFLEDLDLSDRGFREGIEEAIEKGNVPLGSGGLTVPVKDAVVIFCCERSNSVSDKLSSLKSDSRETKKEVEDEGTSKRVPLDLNIAIKDEVPAGAEIGVLECVLDGKFYFAY